MPVIGYMILFNDKITSSLLASSAMMGMQQQNIEPFSHRNLYFLYFGLLVFGLSNALYYIACPDLIKKFSSEYEFYVSEIEVTSRQRFVSMINLMKDKFSYQNDNQLVGPAEAIERMAQTNNRNNRDFWLKFNSDYVMEGLQAYYGFFNESRSTIRGLIFIGYLIATSLVTIPTFITCIKITQLLFNRIHT